MGIPNTLFAAYHLPYWRQLLTQLEIEVVVSGESNKDLNDRGGKTIPPEFCVPVKVFMGHILELIEKKPDLILTPRMTDRGKRNFFCPKLIGLPEIVIHSTGLEETRLLSPEVICNGFNLKMLRFPDHLTSPALLRKAVKQAETSWEEILTQCRQKNLTVPEVTKSKIADKVRGSVKIGLLGYAYSLYDPFISKNITRKLQDLGIQLYTWEMLHPKTVESKLLRLKRPLFWNFGRIILGAGLYFLEEPQIDGIIYATTFGCGPDSIVTKLLSLEADYQHKPFLLITLDEHTGDSHLQTRLDAFQDLLTQRKEKQAL